MKKRGKFYQVEGFINKFIKINKYTKGEIFVEAPRFFERLPPLKKSLQAKTFPQNIQTKFPTEKNLQAKSSNFFLQKTKLQKEF